MTAVALSGREAPTLHSPLRSARWIPVVAAISTYLLYAVPAAWAGRRGISSFQDDAFYYLVTAKHFLQNGTFSFDGITPTNGFHPLWMAGVAAVLRVIGESAAPEQQIFAVKLLEIVVLGLAVLTCCRFFLRDSTRGDVWAWGYLAIVLLLVCPYYVVFQQGMETTLAALLFVLALEAFVSRRSVRLAIAVVLLFLCRLDTAIFVGVPLALAHAWDGEGSRRGRALPLAVLVAGVLAVSFVNVLTTGHAVPISGAIKSSFPHVTFHPQFLVEPINIVRMFGWRHLLVDINILLVGGMLVGDALLLPLANLPPGDRRQAVVVVAIGLLLLANLLLFQQWEKSIDPRYFALPAIAALFGAGTLLGAIVRRVMASAARLARASARDRERFARAASLAACLALLSVGLSLEALALAGRAPVVMAQRDDPTRQLFKDVAAHLPPDAILAGTDVGALAFWTGRPVVNLDGVVNDYAYQDAIRDQRLLSYLHARHVTHLATGLWDRPQTYTERPTEPVYLHQIDAAAVRGTYDCHVYFAYSYVYRVYSDRFCLRAGDEVFRRALGKHGIADTAYVVYRLPR